MAGLGEGVGNGRRLAYPCPLRRDHNDDTAPLAKKAGCEKEHHEAHDTTNKHNEQHLRIGKVSTGDQQGSRNVALARAQAHHRPRRRIGSPQQRADKQRSTDKQYNGDVRSRCQT